jgi:hypothetical protein
VSQGRRDEWTDLAGLTDFLLARIAEDEEVARAAARLGPDWCETSDPREVFGFTSSGDSGSTVCYVEEWVPGVGAPHIARWDPARVLAECKARREIVDAALHAFGIEQITPGAGIEGYSLALQQVLKILARIWKDHPEYQEDWQL